MQIGEMRETIANALSGAECNSDWIDNLSDTDPGHYGVEDVDATAMPEDVWVNVPEKTFTFKDVSLSFSARLGGSSDKNGCDRQCSVTVSGSGKFEFDKKAGVCVESFTVDSRIALL